MNKNAAKIKAGVRSLANKPQEIISGTVVSGSVDTTAFTITVQPSDDGEPIEGVRLNGITGDDNGVILFPADSSNVIIGSIDGPGEWMLLKSSIINKATVKIASVNCNIDADNVLVKNGDVELNMSSSVFRIKTASENMFDLLKDLVTYITQLTVPTAAGTSSPPVNIADFNNIITRISNLLIN